MSDPVDHGALIEQLTQWATELEAVRGASSVAIDAVIWRVVTGLRQVASDLFADDDVTRVDRP